MLRNLNRTAGGRRILGVPDVGILAATLLAETASGDNGPGLLYDDAGAHPGAQLRARITTWPGVGSFFVYENGAFDASGFPDGVYNIPYDVYVDNALSVSDTLTLTFGTGSASAPGGTVTGTGTISAGSTSGDAAASGATLTGVGSIVGGSASADGSATAPGATLTGAGDLTSGQAVGDALAAGAVLTGTGSITGGGVPGVLTADDIDPRYIRRTSRRFTVTRGRHVGSI